MNEDSASGATVEGGAVTVEHHPAQDVFGLLSEETRLAILQALGEADARALTFSELQDRVGTRDSGQFNYHLGKLTGRFVRKTEEGYELSLAGRQVVGALLAGTYTATAETTEPLPVDAPCPECGGEVVATYAEEVVDMRCLDCEDWYNEVTFPPGILDQFAPAELPEAFDRWLLTSIERTHSGFCHNCAGRVTGQVVRDDEHPQGVLVEYPCERCGETATISAIVPLLVHPAGTSLLYDHGIDVRRTPLWEVGASIDEEVTIVEDDPPLLELSIAVGDERVRATLESDLTIRDVQRGAG